ncbi:MAG TPA: GMC family oxidoreductase [Candidatus Saccharimonadales bacterium]|nr:GMC family oxidoreductase [Candidatus Saccharimonadales bacterium]
MKLVGAGSLYATGVVCSALFSSAKWAPLPWDSALLSEKEITMIQNGKNISTPQSAQVCVIGSGPAGVTAAWELSKAGLDVVLLDGGRELDYSLPKYYERSWPDKVKLYNGVADGIFSNNELEFLVLPYDEHRTPAWERERVYGGTSTHWGGQSRPLDSIAFKKRPGFPGWPITRECLDPYYAKAVTLCHLYGGYDAPPGVLPPVGGATGFNFTAEFWADEMQKQGLQAAVPHLANFTAEMYQFMGSQWLNFATRTFDGKPIGDSPVRVIVNATLLNIVEQGGSVKYLEVASMNDDPANPQCATEFSVTADVYILACGAVANARQLLLSGVGNDLVGHYFMCHPLSESKIVTTMETYLSISESNLMNGAGWTDPTGNVNGITGRFTVNENTAKDKEIGQCWFWANNQFGTAQMYFEMAPNYDSYVALDETIDPVTGKPVTDPVFGQQQTYIHWAFSDRDQKTYETNCALFNKAQSGFSSIISWPEWKSVTDQWTVNGHHIGTTRMSASTAPAEGVVDQDLKIHGVNNMYVAGSSVFPSTGISNPTMTIIALSIRLAEHLQAQVGKTTAS